MYVTKSGVSVSQLSVCSVLVDNTNQFCQVAASTYTSVSSLRVLVASPTSGSKNLLNLVNSAGYIVTSHCGFEYHDD